VELLASIEEEFEAQIPESSIGERTTVADLEALIQSGACNLVEPEYADWPLRRPARIARAGFEEIVAAPIMRVMVPSVVSGRDVLSDLGEPVLFASNHTSHLDTAAIISAMPRRVRSRLTVAAAADYWFAGGRLAAWSGALMFNAFPFSRGGNIRPSLERCGVLLDRGWSVLVYPEGTRSTTGQIGEFKSGVGLLAVELHVPVVPIRVNGLDRVLPKGNKLPRRSHVDVTFGEPMRFTLNTPYADAMCAIHAAVKSLGTTIEHASGAPSTVS
jgi:long-chain acyl-CoA synthetase